MKTRTQFKLKAKHHNFIVQLLELYGKSQQKLELVYSTRKHRDYTKIHAQKTQSVDSDLLPSCLHGQ